MLSVLHCLDVIGARSTFYVQFRYLNMFEVPVSKGLK